MAKETLASKVDPSEIVISDEEVGAPNYLINKDFGVSGGYSDYALVERKVAYRTGKEEDGINNGKVISYIKWDVVSPFSYGRTPFDVLNNYARHIGLRKFKQLNKSNNFDDVKQIYLDIQTTINQALKSSQFTDDIVKQGTLIDEIAELKDKLNMINDIFDEADELRALIKDKRRIIIGETEPKKHRTPKEEE